MPNHPHLSKAPIAEAVVEVRVRMSSPALPAGFAAFRDRLKDQFPKSQNIRFLASRMHFESEDEVKSDFSNTLFGIRLDDADGKWVVQAKSDGLAVSRLQPYESWDSLIAMVRKLWVVYTETFKPEAVLRLGARYINRVPLPDEDKVDLDSVLTAGPKIPPKLPQHLAQFVTRIVLPMESEGIVLTILQSLEPTIASAFGRAHVVLDIDAACEQTITPDSPEIWVKLDALREAKNMAFFGSLMDSTWRSFI